ncbi:uncharacterized protein LOC120669350 [Panicum virgatum]|uniref:uncharacterized protein LOC120669350 n=1 Tax=Panicum virgatum TaxID=38727 RepID=UPI0019D4F412|nr:uncharacterized protein LOC120669350 [Panicum virgatum]
MPASLHGAPPPTPTRTAGLLRPPSPFFAAPAREAPSSSRRWPAGWKAAPATGPWRTGCHADPMHPSLRHPRRFPSTTSYARTTGLELRRSSRRPCSLEPPPPAPRSCARVTSPELQHPRHRPRALAPMSPAPSSGACEWRRRILWQWCTPCCSVPPTHPRHRHRPARRRCPCSSMPLTQVGPAAPPLLHRERSVGERIEREENSAPSPTSIIG